MHSYTKVAGLACWLALSAGGAMAGTDDSADRGFRPLAADGGKSAYNSAAAGTRGSQTAGHDWSGPVPSPIVTTVGVERRADGTLRGHCRVLPRAGREHSFLGAADDVTNKGGR